MAVCRDLPATSRVAAGRECMYKPHTPPPANALKRTVCWSGQTRASPHPPSASIATTAEARGAAARTAAPAPARPQRHHPRIFHLRGYRFRLPSSSTRHPPPPIYLLLLHHHYDHRRRRRRFPLAVFFADLGCHRLRSTSCSPPAKRPDRWVKTTVRWRRAGG